MDLGQGEVSKSLYYLVLDDGTADEVTAWIVPEPLDRNCVPDREVAVIAHPWTRRVSQVSGMKVPLITRGPGR